MQIRNTAVRYGVAAQLFHWSIVVLIITQVILAEKADGLPLGPAKIAVLAQHKSVGMTIFMLAVVRLLWRFVNPVPPLPSGMPAWQRVAAHISHGALYALILITPLFGWLMSSARNFPVSWFGVFTFPDLVQPDKARYEFFHGAHELVAKTLVVIAIVHALAALKHQFLDRDGLLRRMLPVKPRQ
ncbi:cytochrome b561 [Povalibacter uvarum]|uniref:Cytochrome b561 n=1 Tax=Povalibacter uvarum TaxID=732238 RepID=A0A841HMK8_9GAMM|nr:cytochrome b [Povalibacter uvarum]MBB6093418.1 cytochrome b561 [Povalibacter uvarum]